MEKPNSADIGVAELRERVSKLEETSHEPRDFVTCKSCDKPVKDYKKHLKYKGKK